jgi:hypothetical protein
MEQKRWTLESVIKNTLFLKIGLIVVTICSFFIIPLPQEFKQFYRHDILYGFYSFDGANYKNICQNGYLNTYEPFPGSIRYFAFLPGLPVLNCVGGAFRSIFDLQLYGPILINLFLFVWLAVSLKWYLELYYKDIAKLKYIWWTFLFFPTSFFIHLNYTETAFLALTFTAMRLFEEGKIIRSSVAGLFLGLFRITAIPIGALLWLRYCYVSFRSYQATKLFSVSKFIKESASFTLYGVGTLITFIYYQLQYNDFWLFFKSQSEFYGRQNGFLENYVRIVDDVGGAKTYWDSQDWSSLISQTGFDLYTRDFRLWALTIAPFIIVGIGTIILLVQRRWFWLSFSLLLWAIPLYSSTNSVNRYLLQSFPFILVISELAYKNVITRVALLTFYILWFIIFLSLHMRGFWIG